MLNYLILVFATFTIYLNAWWGIGIAILLIWKAFKWQRYQSRPWRRIHFPAMILWSGATGLETGRAKKETREYSLDVALQYFVKALHPVMQLEDVPLFIENELAQYRGAEFENLIREKLVSKKAKVSGIDSSKVIENVMKNMRDPQFSLKVRLLIAEVVRSDAGDNEYHAYLRAVLSGQAA